jgi:hypothetical protein
LSIIIGGSESGDILRIPEKYQKYRYTKISQFLEAGQFCRYVGAIKGFRISNKSVLHSRNNSKGQKKQGIFALLGRSTAFI